MNEVQPTRVLLVEDSPTQAQAVLAVLEGAGVTAVELSSDLAEARRLLRRVPIDLVLLDLFLPDSQGGATVAGVRDAAPAVALVVLTAYDDDDVAQTALDAGADDFVSKGNLTPELLKRVMRYALQRKGVEAALRRGEKRFRDFATAGSDWYWEMDGDLRFTWFSEQMEECTGIPPADLLGKSRRESMGPLANGIAGRRHLDEMESHKPFKGFEYLLRVPSGREVWINVSGVPVFDDDGIFQGYRGVGRDVTARHNAERALAKKTEALERSNADLRQFAYVASHDLKEPLRMVTSYVQLLTRHLGDELDEKTELFSRFISEGAQRMHSLINDLLEYSSVDVEEAHDEFTACNEAIDEALANLRSAIDDSGAEIEHGVLPMVPGEKGLLVRLFQNIIGNALKYRAPDRRPHVRIAAEQREGDWVFSIRDNGIGIDPRFAERIFLIFQRLHTRDRYDGTGIGLAICKKIVERHGGRIWVDPAPDGGSIFRFTLPAIPHDHPKLQDLEN